MLPFNKELGAFLELVRAGLWEQDVQLASYGQIDFNEVYRFAKEQSVVGLVAAGIEHVDDVKIPQDVAIAFVGNTLQLEQRNLTMNEYIANLFDKLRRHDVFALMIKGQGIAQCYERPLWRSCGDIDLFMSDDNYRKAKELLVPMATELDDELIGKKHLAMMIDSWEVELHGSLHGGLSYRIDKILDEIQLDVFYGGSVRLWINDKTQIFLLAPDGDIIFVFTHILQHFFKGGIGLRQICDWCRLLWTYQSQIDKRLLEDRIRRMGILTEWKSFASLVVEQLGMPEDVIPLYSSEKKWSNKAKRILSFIIETGNFGHNRDLSYHYEYPFLVYKAISLTRNTWDSMRHVIIFPIDATRVWFRRLWEGIAYAIKGK